MSIRPQSSDTGDQLESHRIGLDGSKRFFVFLVLIKPNARVIIHGTRRASTTSSGHVPRIP